MHRAQRERDELSVPDRRRVSRRGEDGGRKRGGGYH